MVRELSSAVQTLSDSGGDIFGTVRNLQVFVSALAGMDGQVAEFNRRLAGVSDLLHDNDGDLAAALAGVERAATLVEGFLADNRGEISNATGQLAELTRTLAAQRDNLATILHVGPNTLTNAFNILSMRDNGAVTGGLVLDNLSTPAELVCEVMATQAANDPAAGAKTCLGYLGPLLNLLRVQSPPIGINGPLNQSGGGGPVAGPAPSGTDRTAPPIPTGTSELPPPVSLPGLGGLLLPGTGSGR
ncbi:hypothetical protein [Candidatus Protofrankia datiscae]|nr:hypothetical protein [Candidatus Protofrankia datiscae]